MLPYHHMRANVRCLTLSLLLDAAFLGAWCLPALLWGLLWPICILRTCISGSYMSWLRKSVVDWNLVCRHLLKMIPLFQLGIILSILSKVPADILRVHMITILHPTLIVDIRNYLVCRYFQVVIHFALMFTWRSLYILVRFCLVSLLQQIQPNRSF